VGGWKKEPNSTVGVIDEKPVVFEYAAPEDVPSFMEQWFKLYHELMESAEPGNKEKALQAYVSLHVSFVRIHPFFSDRPWNPWGWTRQWAFFTGTVRIVYKSQPVG